MTNQERFAELYAKATPEGRNEIYFALRVAEATYRRATCDGDSAGSTDTEHFNKRAV